MFAFGAFHLVVLLVVTLVVLGPVCAGIYLMLRLNARPADRSRTR